MQFRTALLCLALSGASLSVLAQDRIYTKSGGTFEVKIKEVGTRTIVYKKWSNPDGPDYVMPKNEVERIKFQNGDEETFDRHNMLRPVHEKALRGNSMAYGRNTLSLSPVHMTNTSAVGFGISYERALDKNSIISLYIPLVYSFKNNDGTYYNYSNGWSRDDRSNMVWLYPGAKIYPTGSNGVVRYAVGPMLAFGTGNRKYTTNDWDAQSQNYVATRHDEHVTVMGFMVNNSLNIQPTPRLHMGLELALGIPYYTDESSNTYPYYTHNTYDDVPLVQFNFNVGFRF